MALSRIESLKIKAKLLQKAKKKAGLPMALQQALEAVAKAAGYPSWRECKEVTEETELFCPPGAGAIWKVWYAHYEEARAHLARLEELEGREGAANPHFLLPYGRQFFVCEPDYIRWLGVDPAGVEVEAVGRNWLEPRDPAAWKRILAQVRAERARRESASGP